MPTPDGKLKRNDIVVHTASGRAYEVQERIGDNVDYSVRLWRLGDDKGNETFLDEAGFWLRHGWKIKLPQDVPTMNYDNPPNCPICHTVCVVGNLSGFDTWYCTPCSDFPSFGSTSDAEEGEPCPVTLKQIFMASFDPMSEQDYDGFAGLEGDGLTASIDNVQVVLDLGGDTRTNLQVHHSDGSCWSFSVSGPEKLVGIGGNYR